MTEQENQAIREIHERLINGLSISGYLRFAADVFPRIMDALDERDREVESLRQDCKKLMELSLEASRQIVGLSEENQHMVEENEELKKRVGGLLEDITHLHLVYGVGEEVDG